jgi:hypothetical protein
MANLATDYINLTCICEFTRRLHQRHQFGGEDAIDREFSRSKTDQEGRRDRRRAQHFGLPDQGYQGMVAGGPALPRGRFFAHLKAEVVRDVVHLKAEFETNLRRERQLEGIVKAKAAGKGQPVSIDATKVRAMKAEGKGASEIAKTLKIGRASVYRVLEAGCRRPHRWRARQGLPNVGQGVCYRSKSRRR